MFYPFFSKKIARLKNFARGSNKKSPDSISQIRAIRKNFQDGLVNDDGRFVLETIH